MKYIISIITTIFISIGVYAQSDVTKFLGIPVDGKRKEVVKALKKRGFKTSHTSKDALQGIFNGQTVNVYVLETDGKVSRIAVLPLYGSSASEVRTHFNNLCHQFLNKDTYVAQHNDKIIPTYKDISIPSDENISYEMNVNNKRYEASFIQLPEPKDSILQKIEPLKNTLITISDNNGNKIDLHSYLEMLTTYSNNSIWFKIDEHYGEFYISLFYDNRNNQGYGDDL